MCSNFEDMKLKVAVSHLLALNIPSYFIPISTNTRIHHHQSYHFTYIRTDAYMNSFFPRTIREWNDLPQQVIDSNSLDLFQEQLDIYFNTAYCNYLFFVIVWDRPCPLGKTSWSCLPSIIIIGAWFCLFAGPLWC